MAEPFWVDCCFKLGKFGSIIHDRVDLINHKLEKYSDFVDVSMLAYWDDFPYSRKYYSANRTDYAATCEAFMMRDLNVFFAADFCTMCCACYTYLGECYTYKDLECADKETGVKISNLFDIENGFYVGIEIVDAYQIRYAPYTYRIILKDGYLYTSKGIFKCDIDVSKMTGWKADMKPYADMRYQEKYFGYIFMDNHYLYLYLDEDGFLRTEEVPYEY